MIPCGSILAREKAFRMKIYPLYVMLFGTALASFGAPPSGDSPEFRVLVSSDSKELAKGFAQAFANIAHTPVSLGFERDGILRVLEDVRGIKDADGVIVVEVGKGLTYILNPRDVVFVTDGSVPKTKS
jgi:hypothetical protein